MMYNQQMFARSPEDSAILSMDPNATKGLFVGDLSSFTTEKDLHQIFSPFGSILSVEIKRGRHGDSLLHGFVEFASEAAAYAAIQSMHNRKFKGRRMRVNWTNMKVPQTKNVDAWTLVQVHFNCTNLAMKVTEDFLESVFAPFGSVEDVIIKRHLVSTNPPLVHGNGNVYFLDTIAAMNAMVSMKDVCVNGVTFECTLTMPKGAHSFSAPSSPPAARSSPKATPIPCNYGGHQAHSQYGSYSKGVKTYGTGRGMAHDSRARIQGVDRQPLAYSAPAAHSYAHSYAAHAHAPFHHLPPHQQQPQHFDMGRAAQMPPSRPHAQRSVSDPYRHEPVFAPSAPSAPYGPAGGLHFFGQNLLVPATARPPLPPSHGLAPFDDCFTTISPSNHRGGGSSNASVTTQATGLSSGRPGSSPAECGSSLASSMSKSLSNSNDDCAAVADCARNVAFLSLAAASTDSFTYVPPQVHAAFAQGGDFAKLRLDSWAAQAPTGAFHLDRHLFDLSPSPEPGSLGDR